MSSAAAKNENGKHNDSHSRGKIFLVGIGPGSIDQLTIQARETICKSTVIVGYSLYVELITPLITNQKVIATGMTREIDRCKKALELAGAGETVSLVSSGDPGIYGMAGLLLELNPDNDMDIVVIPGVSAVNAAASLIGAPLMSDFAVLSLSDHLTPWEIIEKRIRCAAEGDFVIAIFNPKSKRRVEHIVKTRQIIKKFRTGKTPVAIVTNAYREGESVVITDLNSFTDEAIGMFSIVIVGNSMTAKLGDKLITERGYKNKYAGSFSRNDNK